jgi:hypothetical protein
MRKSDFEQLEKTARALAEGASAETRHAIETIVLEARDGQTIQEEAKSRLSFYLALALCLAALIIYLASS